MVFLFSLSSLYSNISQTIDEGGKSHFRRSEKRKKHKNAKWTKRNSSIDLNCRNGHLLLFLILLIIIKTFSDGKRMVENCQYMEQFKVEERVEINLDLNGIGSASTQEILKRNLILVFQLKSV